MIAATHLPPHPLATGIALGVVALLAVMAALAACLGVLWLALDLGARLAVGWAG